jgi:hypothetical protein|tara:strand:- start:444 stop:833 length:390 start_codon:yes stop_codon:yes gene_type:complete
MKYLIFIFFILNVSAEIDLTIPEQPAVYIPPKEFILNFGDYNEPPTKNQMIFFWTLSVLDTYTTYEGMKKCLTCKELNPLLPDRPELKELILQKAIIGTLIARNSSESYILAMNVGLGIAVINNYKYIK